MNLSWFALTIVVVTIVHPGLIETRESVFVSEYDISGEDFFLDFMRKERILLVKNEGRELTSLFGQTEVLKEEFHDVIVQSHHHDSDGSRNESLGSVLNGRDVVRFTYDITNGSEMMQRSVRMPSMLMSCQGLFDCFIKYGKVTLAGSINGRTTLPTMHSNQHSIVAVAKGRAKIEVESSPSIDLNRRNLLYIPPGDDVTMECDDDLVWLNFSWSCDEDFDLNCRRESLYSLTHHVNDYCAICRDNSLPDRVLNTGYTIPPIGFGTARLFEKTYEMVKIALSIGYTMIDTANIYSGEAREQGFTISSEHEIGRAIADSKINRRDLFIVTKIDPDFMTFDGTLAKVEQSLKELQTDYLDAVLVHDFVTMDSCGPNDSNCHSSPWIAWRGLEEMQSRGVVRSIGVSNINGNDLAFLIKKFSKRKVSLVQNWFDPFHQDRIVRKICSENNIAYMGYSTLGKVWTDELSYDVNPVLNHYHIVTFSSNNKLPATSSVLRWAMVRDVIVIPSTRDPGHAEQNILTRSQVLDGGDIEAIDDLDNTFGNPEDSEWTKMKFSEEFVRQPSKTNHETKSSTKDEL